MSLVLNVTIVLVLNTKNEPSSDFAVEFPKIEEKDNVMENLYAMFQIREAVGRMQMIFKIGVLKNSLHS